MIKEVIDLPAFHQHPTYNGQGLKARTKLFPLAYNFRLLVLGKSGSGKSGLTRRLMEFILPAIGNDFDKIILLNPTGHLDSIYDGCPVTKTLDEALKKIMEIKNKEQQIEELKEKIKSGEIPLRKLINFDLSMLDKKPSRILLVFDDCAGEPWMKGKKSKLVSFFKKCRHLDVSILVSTQCYVDLDRDARSQLTDIIVFKHLQMEDREFIYKEIVSSFFPTFQEFNKFYEEKTKTDPYANILMSQHNINNDPEIVVNLTDHYFI